MIPTEEQLKIINAPININICIQACPGSGKTSTILYRISELIKNELVNPSSICLLTYNKSLSVDMNKKLLEYGINSKKLGHCGTIHSFCWRETKNPRDLRPWIEKNKNFSVYPNLKYIIFDEYQDADKDIADVISILSKDKYLTIVGDERQQIYSHKGADANLLLNLKNDYYYFSLSISFRCSEPLCKFLTRLFPKYPEVKSNKVGGMTPKLYRDHGNKISNQKILDKIIEIIKEKYNDNSIAIITPVINSDKTRQFLNDIQSNIKIQLGLIFNIYDGDEKYDNTDKHIITTVHKSKGREYDIVLLVNAFDHKNFFNYPNLEALTCFYVAVSRSIKELYLFENLFHLNSSLPWIVENKYLINNVWSKPPGEKHISDSQEVISVTNFIKQLSPDEIIIFQKNYPDEKIIKIEKGIGRQYGNPMLFGILIELLFYIKLLGGIPEFNFPLYITNGDWRCITKKDFDSVREKINIFLDCDKEVDFNYNDGFCEVSYNDKEIMEITNKQIVSSSINKVYYKNFPKANLDKKKLTNKIDKDNIDNLWFLIRFSKLSECSIIKFDVPDLTGLEIEEIITYINSSNLLNELDIIKYHNVVSKTIEKSSNKNLKNNKIKGDSDDYEEEENKKIIEGEIDFETKDSLIEVKCWSGEDLESAKIQVIIYNCLYSDIKECDYNIFPSLYKYKTIYVYNAYSGKLYRWDYKSCFDEKNSGKEEIFEEIKNFSDEDDRIKQLSVKKNINKNNDEVNDQSNKKISDNQTLIMEKNLPINNNFEKKNKIIFPVNTKSDKIIIKIKKT